MGRSTIAFVTHLLALLAMPMAMAGTYAPEAFFTQSETFTLPDGRLGEMRQVRRADILPGPDLLLVLDGEGRVLAKSPTANALTIVCSGTPRACHGYDHDKGELLLIDPAGFRPNDAKVPAVTETDRKLIGPFAQGGQSWGFQARAPTLSERIQAEWAHARLHAGVHALSMALGALLVMLIAVKIGPPKRRTWPRLGLWALSIALRLAAAGYILMILATWLILGGFSWISVLAGTAFGASAALIPFSVLWSRRQKAAAIG